MEQNLVSIIIPTYHRAELLERAIYSALNQTYQNIEIIVVSDNELNSLHEEETITIMNNFSDKANVKYIKSEGNKGGCIARNKGLKIAKGQYINFLDDDDILLPTKIEKQMKLINSSNKELAVVGCCAAIKNSKNKTIRIEKPMFEDDILYSQLKHNICTTSLNLINREICIQSGGFEYIESSQEHLFLIKIFTVKPTFDYVDEVLVEINHHNGPRVSTNMKKPIGALKLAKYVESYYGRYDLSKVRDLRLAHNKNIIQSYCEVRKFDLAFREYLKRYRISLLNFGNIKLPLVILKNIVLK